MVDPDRDLPPPKETRDPAQYVLASEVKDLKKRMDPSSILVVFKYRPQSWSWDQLIGCRRKSLGSFDAIYKGDPSFLCLTKNPGVRSKLQRCLRNHSDKHDMSVQFV